MRTRANKQEEQVPRQGCACQGRAEAAMKVPGNQRREPTAKHGVTESQKKTG